MDRRRILLIIAAAVAGLGTLLVFLYVRTADNRAQASVDAVQVLTANEQIAAGESYDAALAAGKITPKGVARSQLLDSVVTSTDALKGTVALQAIFPGEQIVSDKFGATAEASSALGTIPEGKLAMTVNLTDPDRVAGFLKPGAEVAIFVTAVSGRGSSEAEAQADTQPRTNLLLPKVTVIGVGDTTATTTTTTTSDGTQQTEQVPRTLLTVAVTTPEAQKLILASKAFEVTFALLSKNSDVGEGPPATASDILP
jgi:pilus assembly protein CpaB